jgi:hypothetical protein
MKTPFAHTPEAQDNLRKKTYFILANGTGTLPYAGSA